jgi:hypothetical protein
MMIDFSFVRKVPPPVMSGSVAAMIATQDNNYRLRVAGAGSTSLSVVVPMRNRAFVITRALDALAASEAVDLDVIVVDDVSDDGAFRAAVHPSAAGKRQEAQQPAPYRGVLPLCWHNRCRSAAAHGCASTRRRTLTRPP